MIAPAWRMRTALLSHTATISTASPQPAASSLPHMPAPRCPAPTSATRRLLLAPAATMILARLKPRRGNAFATAHEESRPGAHLSNQ